MALRADNLDAQTGAEHSGQLEARNISFSDASLQLITQQIFIRCLLWARPHENTQEMGQGLGKGIYGLLETLEIISCSSLNLKMSQKWFRERALDLLTSPKAGELPPGTLISRNLNQLALLPHSCLQYS